MLKIAHAGWFALRAPLPSFSGRFAETKSILNLAAPITGAALVNMGMSITDTVMMGRMGPTALAAGTVVSDMYSLAFYFLAGVLAIISPIVARALGANNKVNARNAIQQGFIVAAILAPLGFACVYHSTDLIGAFGVAPGIRPMGQAYSHAMAFTIIPMLFVVVWRNLFEAIGKPRTYLFAILAVLPLNAAGNQLLMFGWGPVPALGLAGAGVASAIVAFALLTGFLAYGALNSEIRRLSIFGTRWHMDFKLLREIIRLGLPIGFFALGEVGLFLVSTVIVALMGVEALAAHAITMRLAGIVYALQVGISQATTVRVSHFIGSNDSERLRSTIKTARFVGCACGMAILVILSASAELLPGQVSGPAQTVEIVAALFILLGLLNLAQGFAGPASAILRAYKDTKGPMILSLTGYWLIGMPIAIFCGFVLNLDVFGIWLGLALGVATNALLINRRLHRREEMVNGQPSDAAKRGDCWLNGDK